MRPALAALLLAACSSSYPAPYDGGRTPGDANEDAFDCRCSATQICCDPRDGLPGILCANHLIDARNCGACANQCAAGQACVNGACR